MFKIIFVIFLSTFLILPACSNGETDNYVTESQKSPKHVSLGTNEKTKVNDFQHQSQKQRILNDSEHKTIHDQKGPINKADETTVKVNETKGIYLQGKNASKENIQTYIDLLNATNLNSVVIDIKDDNGKLTYDSKLSLVNTLKSDANPPINNLKNTIGKLKENNIYTIARIVVFKDPYIGKAKQEWGLQKKAGGLWRDPKGVTWIDPYKKEAWQYPLSIAEEVAELGFDEIQFDYIRFPDNAKVVDQSVSYANRENKEKFQIIGEFLDQANKRLDPYGVKISADVFGLVTTAKDDMGIGQLWETISKRVDYISPMIYPSHYGKGIYGIANPNSHPAEVVKQALQDAKMRNQKLKEGGLTPAQIRPWIQDFQYEKKDVFAQINAVNTQGIEGYILWNAGNKYSIK